MRALRSLVIGLAVLLADETAGAQAIFSVGRARNPDNEDAWSSRPLALEVHVGAGMPLGLVGVAADYSVLDWWSLGLGIGTNNRGVQGAALTRIRVIGGLRKALTLETGYSVGNYQGSDFLGNMMGSHAGIGVDSGYEFRVSPAHWIYIGPGYESRAGHFVFRLFAGWALRLNSDGATCITNETRQVIDCSTAKRLYGTADASPMVPYVGIASGYAF